MPPRAPRTRPRGRPSLPALPLCSRLARRHASDAQPTGGPVRRDAEARGGRPCSLARRRPAARPLRAPPPRRAPATHTCPQGTCTGFSNTSRHTGHVKRLRGSVSDAGFADCAAPSRDSGCAAAILPLRSVALREKEPPRGAGPPSSAHAQGAGLGGVRNPPELFGRRRPPGVPMASR